MQVTFQMDRDEIEDFDEYVKGSKEFDDRSSAIRYAMRELMDDGE